ncbi:ferredoxin [Pseudonocardia eucalypti]|uniref:Ferredoxin n=1 Tax=Pseudonocardia eucalypti TaxID=648755 RepID=A0ABP9QL92_9PSEU|nr:ferredoxin [Pseudonocardia eucalypti]
MRAHIDSKVCTGHGMCYLTAPDVFVDDDEGYGQVLGDGLVAPGHESEAETGAASCPERAITLS